jgi:hypothetical protein
MDLLQRCLNSYLERTARWKVFDPFICSSYNSFFPQFIHKPFVPEQVALLKSRRMAVVNFFLFDTVIGIGVKPQQLVNGGAIRSKACLIVIQQLILVYILGKSIYYYTFHYFTQSRGKWDWSVQLDIMCILSKHFDWYNSVSSPALISLFSKVSYITSVSVIYQSVRHFVSSRIIFDLVLVPSQVWIV